MNNADITITFLKEFADTNYFIIKHLGGGNKNNPYDRSISFFNFTTTTATTFMATSFTFNRWMACGYIK